MISRLIDLWVWAIHVLVSVGSIVVAQNVDFVVFGRCWMSHWCTITYNGISLLPFWSNMWCIQNYLFIEFINRNLLLFSFIFVFAYSTKSVDVALLIVKIVLKICLGLWSLGLFVWIVMSVTQRCTKIIIRLILTI